MAKGDLSVISATSGTANIQMAASFKLLFEREF
jgi:hypothetical protein